jgi:ABC-type cobalt transport system substrate-binding protein
MKIQNSRFKIQNSRFKIQNLKFKIYILLLSLLLFSFYFSLLTFASAAKWAGVDESIVEKYAEEHGRAARDPIINTDQGDLLLFVFLLAGAFGGFAAGYYWRTLVEYGKQRKEQKTGRVKGYQ